MHPLAPRRGTSEPPRSSSTTTSTDRTPEIRHLAAEDPRIKPVSTHSLPNGWNGKQHACQRMGEAASGEWMLFTDADVRFERDWLRRTLEVVHPRPPGLLSAFPWERTGSIGEASSSR